MIKIKVIVKAIIVVLFDVYSDQECYLAYSEVDGNTYIIQSKNIEQLILVAGGLRKAQK